MNWKKLAYDQSWQFIGVVLAFIALFLTFPKQSIIILTISILSSIFYIHRQSKKQSVSFLGYSAYLLSHLSKIQLVFLIGLLFLLLTISTGILVNVIDDTVDLIIKEENPLIGTWDGTYNNETLRFFDDNTFIDRDVMIGGGNSGIYSIEQKSGSMYVTLDYDDSSIKYTRTFRVTIEGNSLTLTEGSRFTDNHYSLIRRR